MPQTFALSFFEIFLNDQFLEESKSIKKFNDKKIIYLSFKLESSWPRTFGQQKKKRTFLFRKHQQNKKIKIIFKITIVIRDLLATNFGFLIFWKNFETRELFFDKPNTKEVKINTLTIMILMIIIVIFTSKTPEGLSATSGVQSFFLLFSFFPLLGCSKYDFAGRFLVI